MKRFENEKILRDVLKDGLQENVPMRDYTTMRVGGVADFFYQAKTMDDLVLALHTCFENEIPYLVIGSGSNIIVSDAGFPGLVIHNITTNMSFMLDKSQVIVDSGAIYARVVTEAAARGLGGIEYWFGLPGTIGGAVHNNAETWGHDMSEVVKQVTLMFPPENGKPDRIERVPVSWLNYQYRTSKLKYWQSESPKPVILTVTLQLQQQNKEEIMRKMKESKQGRWDLNQPKGLASSGSFFKNPGGASHLENPAEERKPESSAGWLLDQVGAKKMRVGGAAVAKEHANFLINPGTALASDVRALATELKGKVYEKFGIELEEEVEYVGVWANKDNG